MKFFPVLVLEVHSSSYRDRETLPPTLAPEPWSPHPVGASLQRVLLGSREAEAWPVRSWSEARDPNEERHTPSSSLLIAHVAAASSMENFLFSGHLTFTAPTYIHL